MAGSQALFDAVNDELDKFAAMGHAVDAIEEIAKWGADDGQRSADALATVSSVVGTLRGMFEGRISAQDTEEEIQLVKHALIGVDQKFDVSEF